MTNSNYTDMNFPPASPEVLQYHRGDGKLIKIYVHDGAEPYDPAPPPKLVYQRNPQTPAHPMPKLLVPTKIAAPADSIFDNPIIGGKFTAFVLLYGPSKYHPLHRQCLDAIISTTPIGRMDLRVISNELCVESVAYVEQLQAQGVVSKHYQNKENIRKYPAMRAAFWDADAPIETKWILWFDDDSIADRDPQWLTRLSESIVAGYPQGAHMYGAEFYSVLSDHQIQFYRQQPWFKGRPLLVAGGKEAANGTRVRFAAGGCWALSTEAMRACDIPATNLLHNGGDIAIGCQLHQGGYKLQAWNGQKQFVHTSSVERRGLSEPHYGTPGYLALKNEAKNGTSDCDRQG